MQSTLLSHNPPTELPPQGLTVASDKSDNLQSYFRSQQVSVQWLQVLRAMATELSGHVEAQDLRQIFSRIGVRFSKEVEAHFEDVKTLKALETSLNDFWSRLHWGWVDMAEVKGGIDICHSAAPLTEAFGEESMAWSHGLLEGFYQHIFEMLDNTPGLSVFEVDGSPDAMHIRFRYGRK